MLYNFSATLEISVHPGWNADSIFLTTYLSFYRDSEIMQQKQKAANEKKTLQAEAK
uniref:Uncharacterized protein n=1 Tax=Gopherus agassizii TaxID=38772 RepID=A0A452HJH4_9SAUR